MRRAQPSESRELAAWIGDLHYLEGLPPAYGSRPGDLVLDPFAGAATVGVVSLRHGRRFIGLELNASYAEMARARLGGLLFAETSA